MSVRTALATHRLLLAAVALLLPRHSGRLFGLDFEAQPQAAVLTRLMASRNLLLGVGLLAARGDRAQAAVRLNRAVDLIDLASVAEEARRRSIPARAIVIGGLTAGSAAVLGWAGTP